MKTCPFFQRCGGCQYDCTAPNYRDKKIELINDWNLSFEPFWTDVGVRRRAGFAFADGKFGFFEQGTKNIVPIRHCLNLVDEINALLPQIADLPFDGAGTAMITLCENGLDLYVTSNVPYFSREFKNAVEKLGFIRVTWNGAIVCQTMVPQIRFDDAVVDYPVGAFLQPTVQSERAMREFVADHAKGARHVADLFCGIGNFAFALKSNGKNKTVIDGFDIAGVGQKRDLFKKPLTAQMLNSYDLVIMDPPRAGADAQCRELAASKVPKIIYISCYPKTLRRDLRILKKSGYKVIEIAAFDQFVGSPHWEMAVFLKK